MISKIIYFDVIHDVTHFCLSYTVCSQFAASGLALKMYILSYLLLTCCLLQRLSELLAALNSAAMTAAVFLLFSETQLRREIVLPRQFYNLEGP